MKIKLVRADISAENIIRSRGLGIGGAVQKYIDSEVLRLCDPYVPRDNGDLIDSGPLSTVIGSGQVSYDTPYARRWYYEAAQFQGAPQRGNYWFERMKNEGGKKKILRGAARIAGGKAYE